MDGLVSGASPAISAILLSHNCAGLIADAFQGVLAQDCEPMEVIVSDDASDDETWVVLQRELAGYGGPHRVSLRRRTTNSGSKSAHLNDVFPLATGRVFVSFDGDDVSEPDRVRKLLSEFRRNSQVSAVYSGYRLMDAEGRTRERGRVPHPQPETDARRWFARVDAYASGATLAVRRDVFDIFGPLDPLIHEDVVLPFRASLLGSVHYLDQDLVRVRRWQGSLTADFERLASIERYRARMLLGIERARHQLESRLRDLQLAEDIGLGTAAEMEELRDIARDTLAEAEMTAGLVSPSFVQRLRCFMRLVRTGAYRAELLPNAALAIAPGLYLRYKRRRF
jgi:glycosyltransferase involved in cell wall biosynthesis